MTTGLAYDGWVLLGFGGPEHPGEVDDFLERVTAGRGVPRQRLAEASAHYRALGGVSPLNGQNRDLLRALTRALADAGIALPSALANRNSPPFIPDVVDDLARRGCRRLLAVATTPYAGYSSCRQYREDLAAASGRPGRPGDVSVVKLPPYADLPGFVRAAADLVLAALPADLDIGAATTRLVFTAHSIPVSAAAASGPQGNAYLVQHRRVATGIAARIEAATGRNIPWDLVFQSRSGPVAVPWLEPDVNDHLRRLADGGTADVVAVPIGFLSDHVEVLWDLDIQARATAADIGLRLVRTPTVGTHPAFVADLATRIAAELRAGSPAAGPGQCCFGDCCADPRLARPAVAGAGAAGPTAAVTPCS